MFSVCLSVHRGEGVPPGPVKVLSASPSPILGGYPRQKHDQEVPPDRNMNRAYPHPPDRGMIRGYHHLPRQGVVFAQTTNFNELDTLVFSKQGWCPPHSGNPESATANAPTVPPVQDHMSLSGFPLQTCIEECGVVNLQTVIRIRMRVRYGISIVLIWTSSPTKIHHIFLDSFNSIVYHFSISTPSESNKELRTIRNRTFAKLARKITSRTRFMWTGLTRSSTNSNLCPIFAAY